ncbi:MAG TPA: hypothetical protein VES67_20260 [Vicinamibacterales bacterium]|nr:hypothetical protein [Vicinamibacterales bacterium]
MATMSTGSREHLGHHAVSAISLELSLGVGAIAGGAALMLGPRGEIIPLPLSSLIGTPFNTYFVPGLILFAVLGVGPLGAAAVAWRRHPTAPLLALGVGLALLIWIAAQIAFIGYSNDPPLQAVYLLLGLLIALVGLSWLRKTGWTVGRPSALRGAAISQNAGQPSTEDRDGVQAAVARYPRP